jgi:small subunit ribosomal protein S4
MGLAWPATRARTCSCRWSAVGVRGLTTSRRGARQLSRTATSRQRPPLDVPSAQLRAGDRLSVSGREPIRKHVKDALEQRSSYPMPAWLERDNTALEGRVTALPARTDVAFDVREQLIVELMSK